MKYLLMQKKRTGQYLRSISMGNKINHSKELKIFLENTNLDFKLPNSVYGKVHLWLGHDTPFAFRKWAKYGLLDYYRKHTLTYDINKDGCRSEFEFNEVINDQTPVDIYLGCSHTFGVAHLWENTWPYIVSKETGNKIVNLGKGGTGMDFAYMRLITFIQKMNVQNVFHYQPIYSRWTVKDINSFNHIGVPSNMGEASKFFTDKYITDNLIDYGVITYNHLKTLNAIRQVCTDFDVPYYYLTNFESKKTKHPKPCLPDTSLKKYKKWLGDYTPARDLVHYPVEVLKDLANNFIEKIKVEPSGYVEKVITLPSNTKTLI